MQKLIVMSSQPIAIVGAGLGGVTLGRCLLERGIPAVLYERMFSSPRYNYGVTLHGSTYRPLLEVLGIDERTFRRHVSVDGSRGGDRSLDSALMAHRGEIGPGSFRAHRHNLETLLREGLDVRWDHALDKVQEVLAGIVLWMENGQRIEQKCVIGVDGTHSKTRMSFLPNVDLTILPFVVFNGKRGVSRSVFQELYAPVMQGQNIIEWRKNGIVLNISVNENAGDLVGISWVYSRASRGSDDLLYRPNRLVSGATNIPEEFYREIASLRDLGQPFKEVFDEEKLRTDRVLSWLMRTVDVELSDLQELAKKGVYFMGDSVHSQPILGGEGANAAIKDGHDLAEQIANQGPGSIAAWYSARYGSWKDGVEKSRRMIEEMHTEPRSNL